jgi:serine/threonine protein kinase
MAELVGKTLNHFRVSALLGEGGMGAVYRAHDTALQRDVALKVLHPQFARQTTFQERFRQEARAAARLDHPGVVRVFEFGEWQGLFFIAMEFIPGGNLRKLLQELKQKGEWIALPEAVRLVREVCLAVDYTHQQGVLHRDLKPDNIMIKPLRQRDLPFQPVLTDLGLAKLVEGGIETQTGITMGTPAYMSPEQALGKQTSPRSDIYSLGVLLYELVTSNLPYQVSTLTEVVRLHLEEWKAPPLPSNLPISLAKVFNQTIMREPEKRFQTAGRMAELLDASLPDIQAAPETMAIQGRAVSLVTPYQNSLVEPHTEQDVDFPPLKSADQDCIHVLAANQTAHVIPLKSGSLTVGRTEENDVILPDPKVSRHHARIDYDGLTCKVIDLHSTNGTFLDDARLLPDIPEIWNPVKILAIGDSHLRLVVKEKQKPVKEATQGIVAGEGVMSLSRGGRIGLNLHASAMEVEAGGSVGLRASLFNQGSLVDHFRLAVEGVLPAWVFIATPEVQLMPNQQQEVDLRFSPPRSPQSLEKAYPVTIKAISRSSPGEAAEAQVSLTVRPYYQYAMNLRPQKQTAPGQVVFTLGVSSQCNTNLSVEFSAQDSEDLCLFQFSPEVLNLAAGKEETVKVQVSARVPLTRWESRAHPFTISARPREQTSLAQQVRGEWVQAAPDLQLNLSPERQSSAHQADFTLQIINQSVCEAALQLEGSGAGCAISFSPQHMTIAPAETHAARVTVQQQRGKERQAGDQAEELPFTLTARLSDAPTLTREVTGTWEALPEKPAPTPPTPSLLLLPEPIRLHQKATHRIRAFFIMLLGLAIVTGCGFFAGTLTFEILGHSDVLAILAAGAIWLGGLIFVALQGAKDWWGK